MEQILDDEYWRQGSRARQIEGEAPHPDWHALHSRLVAAREAWSAMESGVSGDLAHAQGSFSGAAAKSLWNSAARKGPVNPIDSANLNRGERMDNDVAGVSKTGGRG